MEKDIIKVAILPIVNKKLFMCRKKGLDFLVNLGGRIEIIDGKPESDEVCAIRETYEEARCGVVNLKHYMTTRAPRQDEPGEIELRCYFGDLVGIPKINPSDSIYEFVWVDRNWEKEGHKLPASLSKVMPMLIEQKYL